MDIRQVAAQFSKEVTSIEEIGGGHINKTYKIEGTQSCVLQEINTNVFRDPQALFDNLVVLERELLGSQYPYQVVGPVQSIAGEGIIYDGKRAFRAISYIEGSPVNDSSPELNRVTGIAYAHFTKALLNAKPESFAHTIPDFHNPSLRFEQFIEATEKSGQVSGPAQTMIDHALALSMILKEHDDIQEALPVRITHNDAKLANVLFDGTGSVKAIVDLDTVMPGYIMHDFGDMVRSMCSTQAEDSTEKARFDLEMFEALSQGYLSVIEPQLSDEEIISLIAGTKSMIYTQFLRFLGDHLNGNIYYKVDYANHNLDRATNQLSLLLDFLAKQEDAALTLERIVNG